MKADRNIEKDRYNIRSASKGLEHHVDGSRGSSSIPLVLQAPYLHFEKLISASLDHKMVVLEVGAGTGEHSGVLVDSGAIVVALDISENSLRLMKRSYIGCSGLVVSAGDMEFLPFRSHSFDMVTSAGSLSYGDNQRVMREIWRVLKPNGVFICVDSLNHSWVYRLNRWWRFKRGDRSLSTLKRMPNLELLDAYLETFGRVECRFFGAITWLMPIFCRILGPAAASLISDKCDHFFQTRASAFKFVMLATKVLR